jgi:hypothetical protein
MSSNLSATSVDFENKYHVAMEWSVDFHLHRLMAGTTINDVGNAFTLFPHRATQHHIKIFSVDFAINGTLLWNDPQTLNPSTNGTTVKWDFCTPFLERTYHIISE